MHYKGRDFKEINVYQRLNSHKLTPTHNPTKKEHWSILDFFWLYVNCFPNRTSITFILCVLSERQVTWKQIVTYSPTTTKKQYLIYLLFLVNEQQHHHRPQRLFDVIFRKHNVSDFFCYAFIAVKNIYQDELGLSSFLVVNTGSQSLIFCNFLPDQRLKITRNTFNVHERYIRLHVLIKH